MVVADFVKVCFTVQHALLLLFYFHLTNLFNFHPTQTGKVWRSPADLEYREDLLFPGGFVEDAGNVKVGQALYRVVKPSKLNELKELFPEEKFIPSPGNKWIDLVLDQNATGEDALKGWLVAAYALSTKKFSSLAKGS